MQAELSSSSSGTHRRLILFGIFAAAVFVTLPPQIFPSQQVMKSYRLLDTSWQLSMPMEFGEGKLSGRDFIYTYGPVYQLTQSLGLLIPPGDLASVSRFRSLPGQLIVLCGLWWALSLTGAGIRYRGAVFLLWCVIMAAPLEFHALRIKPMAGIPAAALCGVLLGRARSPSTKHSRAWLCAVWGVTGPLLTLYSFDFGIIVAATLLGTAILHVVDTRKLPGDARKRSRINAVLAAGSISLGMLLLLGGTQLIPAWKNYAPNMFALVIAYGNAMAMSGTTGRFLTLALALGTSGVLLLYLLWRSPTTSDESEDHGSLHTALIAMACFCMLMVRYGLTRTDWEHVHTAVAPAMFLFGCFLPALLYARREGLTSQPKQGKSRAADGPSKLFQLAQKAPYVLPAVVLVVPLVAQPFGEAFYAGWQQRLTAMSQFDFKPSTVRIADRTLAQATTASEALPEQSLYVWPYGVEINLLAKKENPSYTLQSIEGAIGDLERQTVEHLKQTDDLAGLIYRDAKALTSVSRTSALVRYLLDGFELSYAPQPGFALLQRNPESAPWTEIEIDLGTEPIVFEPGDSRAVQLSLEEQDVRYSDILVARVRIAKTSNFPVGKSGTFFAGFVGDNQNPRYSILSVQPDGETHDVLLSPLDLSDDRCLSHFVPDRTWQTTERVKAIQFSWSPFDFLSKRPAEVQIERLAILRRPNEETKESPLAERENPTIWQWCYGSLPKSP